jgi:hypothetical protein
MGIDCRGGSNDMDQERHEFVNPVPRLVSHPMPMESGTDLLKVWFCRLIAEGCYVF